MPARKEPGNKAKWENYLWHVDSKMGEQELQSEQIFNNNIKETVSGSQKKKKKKKNEIEGSKNGTAWDLM